MRPALDAGDNPGGRTAANTASDLINKQTAALETKAVGQAAIAQWLKDHPPPGTTGPGSGSGAQTNAVQDHIDSLRQELDVMRASDPVQQEMLKTRKLLAEATPAQTEAIHALIAAQQQEAGLAEAMDAFGQASYAALSGLILEGKSAADVMKGLEKAILSAALQALVLGEGPLSGLFGTKGISIFDIIGTAFGGKKAEGGMIYGAGGARDDKVMIAASAGEYIINGRAANANRPLLDYINGGGQMARFAGGGPVGGGPAWRGPAGRGPAGGGPAGSGPVTLSIAIDARGAQLGVADQIAARFDALAPRIGQIAVAAVAQARSRGVMA